MYYAFIDNGKINGCGQCECVSMQSVEITEEMFNNIDRYTWNGSEVVLDPDYEEKAKAKEQDRINYLKMTSLDLIKGIKALGITDEEVESFLNSHLSIKHELQFCQNVYCGIVKQFLPVEISEGVMLTEELVEHLFKVKNGEES